MKKAEIASDYKHWLQELKQRIRQSQIKAAVRVNTALLELYWSIGADIVDRQVEEKWGSGVTSGCRSHDHIAAIFLPTAPFR